MSGFIKKIWKDRVTEFPTRRSLTKQDGSVDLVTVAREEGTVSQEGDAFSAKNMNDLEERVKTAFDAVDSSLGDIRYIDKTIDINYTASTTVNSIDVTSIINANCPEGYKADFCKNVWSSGTSGVEKVSLSNTEWYMYFINNYSNVSCTAHITMRFTKI